MKKVPRFSAAAHLAHHQLAYWRQMTSTKETAMSAGDPRSIETMSKIEPVATMSLCCGQIRHGEQPEGVMHDGLCRERHGGKLGETHLLYPASALAAARRRALIETCQLLRDLRMAWIEQYGETTAWDSGHCSAYAKAEESIRALIEKPPVSPGV